MIISPLIAVILFGTFPEMTNGIFNVYPNIKAYPIKGDPGNPLILTPMIEAGKIEEAQRACLNKPFKSNITSYSAYLTVNKQFNSNLFFWFFPAVQNTESAPVVLWLQGGPGLTSLYGIFNENGPFSVKNVHGLKLRKYTWITTHSVIYIDNPVGTGFSFTDKGGYSENEVDVGENLYLALVQFFTLFPQYQKNDFYVTGESYAGKYVPAVSYTIDGKNPSSKVKINLKGLAIGNGLCDPEHMSQHGDYLYQIGLLDSNGRDLFTSKEKSIVQNIQQKNFMQAFLEYHSLWNENLVNPSSIFKNLTGFSLNFNYLHAKPYKTSNMRRYLAIGDVRKNLHVGNTQFILISRIVQQHLFEDFMQSVKPWVEGLLEKYRVLIYSGQLDIIVAFPLSEGFLDALNWSGASDYKNAPRKQWYVGADLAGYSKVVKNLSVVLVRNAGHMVTKDQPQWALDMITRFTRSKPF